MKLFRYKLRTFFSRSPRLIIYLHALFFVLYRIVSRRDLVIVFSPGKTGSSSIYYSLLKKTRFAVFHVHYLSGNRLSYEFSKERNSRKRGAAYHLYVSYWLGVLIKYVKKVKVVLLMRETKSRFLSGVFQNLNMLDKEIFDFRSGHVNETALLSYIEEKASEDAEELDSYLSSEVAQYLQINEFPLVVNSLYHRDKFDILYSTIDAIDLEQEVCSLLGLDRKISFDERYNVGSRKFYAKDYLEIRKKMQDFSLEKFTELDKKMGL